MTNEEILKEFDSKFEYAGCDNCTLSQKQRDEEREFLLTALNSQKEGIRGKIESYWEEHNYDEMSSKGLINYLDKDR